MGAIIPALMHRIPYQNSAVKRAWVRVVLGWVTSWEVLVLHPSFYFFQLIFFRYYYYYFFFCAGKGKALSGAHAVASLRSWVSTFFGLKIHRFDLQARRFHP